MINSEQILSIMAIYILPFARLSGFLMTLSIIGSRNVPARFRLLLALSIVVIIAPLLPETEPVELFSFKSSLVIIQQSLIGIVLGFVTRLLLESFVVGGQIIAMQSGLGFASLVDPTSGTSVPALGQFYLMITTLLFLAFDGHLLMIQLLVESFYTIPIGGEYNIYEMFYQITYWFRWVFITALLMALVAISSLLIVNISFGVMTRAAPQINIFAVGFPLTMISGLLLVWLSLVYFLPHFENQLTRSKELVCLMIQLEC